MNGKQEYPYGQDPRLRTQGPFAEALWKLMFERPLRSMGGAVQNAAPHAANAMARLNDRTTGAMLPAAPGGPDQQIQEMLEAPTPPGNPLIRPLEEGWETVEAGERARRALEEALRVFGPFNTPAPGDQQIQEMLEAPTPPGNPFLRPLEQGWDAIRKVSGG